MTLWLVKWLQHALHASAKPLLAWLWVDLSPFLLGCDSVCVCLGECKCELSLCVSVEQKSTRTDATLHGEAVVRGDVKSILCLHFSVCFADATGKWMKRVSEEDRERKKKKERETNTKRRREGRKDEQDMSFPLNLVISSSPMLFSLVRSFSFSLIFFSFLLLHFFFLLLPFLASHGLGLWRKWKKK